MAIAWLPTILQDAGLSAAHAGSLHGLLQLATAIPGLLLGPILARMKDQRAAAITVSSTDAPMDATGAAAGAGPAGAAGLARLSRATLSPIRIPMKPAEQIRPTPNASD